MTCSLPPHGPTTTPTLAPGATNAASTAIERGGANVLAPRSRRAHPNETEPDATEGAVLPPGGRELPDRSPYSPPRVTVVQIPIRPVRVRKRSEPKLPCSTIAPEGNAAPGDHQRAAHPRRGFTSRPRRFEDSMEASEMEA